MDQKTIGYIRVSTEKQDLKNQQHTILTYANDRRLTPVEFIEVKISSRKNEEDRKIAELIEQLMDGGTLIVSDLTRLGRSVGGIVSLLNRLIAQNVKVHMIKENLFIDPLNRNPFTDFQINVISAFGQLERDIISQRTKDALAARKARGVKLGRKKGSTRPGKLTPYHKEILEYLNVGNLPLASIAKIINSKMEEAKLKPASYQTFIAYINKNKELKKARDNYNKQSLLSV